MLREKWQSHIDTALFRPVLVVDEAQEMQTSVLNELRLLCSTRLDSHLLLTTVLAGDNRLVERLRSDELLPLGSRMRVRLPLEHATPDEMLETLRHALAKAGNGKLMTTLCEHATGNYRSLMNMGSELLAVGAHRELKQLDEKLYLEVFAVPPPAEQSKPAQSRRR